MKLFKYLKWRIKDYTFTDWAFIASACMLGAYVPVREDDLGTFFLMIGVGIIFLLFVNLALNEFKKDYDRFCNEQQDFLTKIKNSHKDLS